MRYLGIHTTNDRDKRRIALTGRLFLSRRKRSRLLLVLSCLIANCTNNPYSADDSERKVVYRYFIEAPRTLDPAVAYTYEEHRVIGAVFATLLEYHYLKRPYTLIPGLAKQVPTAQPLADGRVAYQFELRQGLRYEDDVCFSLGANGRASRPIVAADIAFEIMRIADPAVNSPVPEPFANIDGFREFTERLIKLRKSKPGFGTLPVREQYAQAGSIKGLELEGNAKLRVVLNAPYPQILYWFAMLFTTPVPWEAVQYYDGRNGRARLADHPVASGPFRLAVYDKQARMVLEARSSWRANSRLSLPGTVYPSQGEAGDRKAGRLDPRAVGQPLPFVDRIEYRREKESIPAFNKFLQGYYDIPIRIIKESFDKVIQQGALSPEMVRLGMRLDKAVMPVTYYIGFNMEDPVVGARGGERSRKLRQAMSLVVDSNEYCRLFYNGLGVPAQSPLPPGIYGYEPSYRNPYRTVDYAKAKRLLVEAGYRGGVDPKTGAPLRLTFDSYETSPSRRLAYQFFVNAWRKLGIDVEIDATNYNAFQEKARNGAYQIFMWGWNADYPDPENFFFLLWSEMRRSKTNEGPNSANFFDPEYDRLFMAMRTRDNDAERLQIIGKMRAILEEQRPWIELYHREEYSLYHGWVKNYKPMPLSEATESKYEDIDAHKRAALRATWNAPVLWPIYLLLALFVALLVPAVATYLKERQ